MKGTHPLETVEGRTCQGTERKPPSKGHKLGTAERVASEKTERKWRSKGHSPSGGHGGKDTSGIEQKCQSRGCSLEAAEGYGRTQKE